MSKISERDLLANQYLSEVALINGRKVCFAIDPSQQQITHQLLDHTPLPPTLVGWGRKSEEQKKKQLLGRDKGNLLNEQGCGEGVGGLVRDVCGGGVVAGK